MPYPETLEAKPKCIFFTDFDGTITLMDSEFPEKLPIFTPFSPAHR